MKDNRFYVYSLINPNTLESFYIGKGSNGRIDAHFHESQAHYNPHKWNKIQKLRRNGLEPDEMKRIIFDGLTEEKAYELEKEIIEEIGLENLTNVKQGGGGGSKFKGEDCPHCKITRKEAAWIRYMVQNSDFGARKLHQHYQDCFESDVTEPIIDRIAQGKSWKHVEPEKPPFWDEEFENQTERRYQALCEWRLSDKSCTEVAATCEFTRAQIQNIWFVNCFDLKDRFLEEHPNYFDQQEQKIERRYEALVEWRTTGKTAKEVAEESNFTCGQLRGTWQSNVGGLRDRFLRQHPDYFDQQEQKQKEKIDRLYEALCAWRLESKSAREVAEERGFKKQQIYDAWNRNDFGLKTLFLDEHPSYQN